MASGEGDNGFGADLFLAWRRGKLFFSIPCVCTQNAQIFAENSNVGEKHEKKFDPLTRPPSRPLAARPSICQLSPVIRGGGGGLA